VLEQNGYKVLTAYTKDMAPFMGRH
jgi:hypothetical protein